MLCGCILLNDNMLRLYLHVCLTLIKSKTCIVLVSLPQMTETEDITNSNTPTTTNVDDAVGVSEAKWFIAIVNNRSEKISAERLAKCGIECYVPVLEEVRLWKNGKRVKTQKVMIPSKLFIHCTEHERRKIVKLPYIFRFMTDKARTSSNGITTPLATVPGREIDQLKFMLGVPDAKVTFAETFVKGDNVKVRRGPFRGLSGIVLQDNSSNKSHLYINIDFLGSAFVEIDVKDVTPYS